MKTMTKIYDTSSLLLITDDLLQSKDKIVITSITLKELERIKTSANKDTSVKYTARKLLRLLDENPEAYICYIYKPSMNKWLEEYNLEINDDAKILAAAYDYKINNPREEILFYTNDLALKKITSIFFKDKVTSIINDDDYTGYINIYLSEDEMASFYSNPLPFGQNLKINQYINIYENDSQNRVDTLCWTGENFR